ncbi:ABC transporter permease [Streptomyces sp. NPDC005811]|uniref:ABC transporter permease n=1 Tax=Streptomyces sp. NPDC005811 TaxID=3154565 RepID=UPI0033C2B370
MRTRQGKWGLMLLVLVLAVAVIGPLTANSISAPVGVPGAPPGPGAPLGTDFLGRDVLSRALAGGVAILWVSALAVVGTYVLGVGVGTVAGMTSRGWVDQLLMRGVDLFVAFPPMLLLLVLITGTGGAAPAVVIGIVLVLFPGVARVTRAATLEVSRTGYVEAAVARGERPGGLIVHEVLPNILPTIAADAGVRSPSAVFLVASLNFLGVGASPPDANWALMITENRSVMATNMLSVLVPAALLAVLAISVNLIADAVVQTAGRSGDVA